MSPRRGFFSLNVDSESHLLDGEGKVITAKPLERIVNQAVDDVVHQQGARKTSETHYTTESSSSSSSSNLAIKNPSSRRAITRKYDTSDL